jgi:hypothetical protein
MIPVFQTRYAVETFGNCFEACIASILELPLAAVPDRAQFVDADAWADLVATTRRDGGDVGELALPTEYDAGEERLRGWLNARGLAWLDLELDDARNRRACLEVLETMSGYWIGHTESYDGWRHATVWHRLTVVHNPHRGTQAVDVAGLRRASLLVACDPPLLARRLDPLPDIAGALKAVAA